MYAGLVVNNLLTEKHCTLLLTQTIMGQPQYRNDPLITQTKLVV